jgi:hypothetical protein
MSKTKSDPMKRLMMMIDLKLSLCDCNKEDYHLSGKNETYFYCVCMDGDIQEMKRFYHKYLRDYINPLDAFYQPNNIIVDILELLSANLNFKAITWLWDTFDLDRNLPSEYITKIYENTVLNKNMPANVLDEKLNTVDPFSFFNTEETNINS